MSADVELITAHDTTLQARIKSPPNSEGPARAFTRRIQAGEDKLSFYADVEKELPVRVGDLVVLADELQFASARGMLLGRVAQVTEYTPDPYLLKRLIIRPDVDPRRLPEVAVLLPDDE
jgi:cell shape-determining protein MreC